jgi:hypothetical protein
VVDAENEDVGVDKPELKDDTPSSEDGADAADSSSAKRKSEDETDESEPATRESVIASITLPEDFDVSTGVKIPCNLAAFPNVDLLSLVAGLKDCWTGYFPNTSFYVGGLPSEPFILAVGEGAEQMKEYVDDMFSEQSKFNQSAEYSKSIFDSLPSKKRSRFASADGDAMVHLGGQGYTGGLVAADSSSSTTVYIPEDKVRSIICIIHACFIVF